MLEKHSRLRLSNPPVPKKKYVYKKLYINFFIKHTPYPMTMGLMHNNAKKRDKKKRIEEKREENIDQGRE